MPVIIVDFEKEIIGVNIYISIVKNIMPRRQQPEYIYVLMLEKCYNKKRRLLTRIFHEGG